MLYIRYLFLVGGGQAGVPTTAATPEKINSFQGWGADILVSIWKRHAIFSRNKNEKTKKTHRCLAARPRRRLQHDRADAAADVQELVLRREVAVAEHLIHCGLENGAIPFPRKVSRPKSCERTT